MPVRTVLLSLASLGLLLAAPAGAARIDFVWQSTGTREITVAPGQEVVLEGRVATEGEALYGAAVSALAPTALLSAQSATVCPSGCGMLQPAGVNNIVLNGSPDDGAVVDGLSGSFAAINLAPEDEDFVLFALTYLVVGVGSGEMLPYFRTGIDGLADSNLVVLFPPVEGADFSSGISLTVIPEPATSLLLAGGLGVLASRRRSARR